MKRFILLFSLLIPLSVAASVAPEDTAKVRKTFTQRLLQPIKWIGKNWSAYDPRYSTPAFYNWVGQFQNTTSAEWLNLKDEGIDVQMQSNWSNKMGPHLGYRFLFYGYTIDLNTIGRPKKNKSEFNLSINSNLVNIDLVRRRTGGDFSINKMLYRDNEGATVDLRDFSNYYGAGDIIKNSLTGFNLNFFTNHKKYSNPAAFSNGAIQLRSVGSPILGFGYMRQKMESDLTYVAYTYALNQALEDNRFSAKTLMDLMSLMDENGEVSLDDTEALKRVIYEMLDDYWPLLRKKTPEARTARALILNRFPTTTVIDDYHLQLGYAYNLVFSRRLLLGLSAIASPGIKHVRYDNKESMAWQMSDQLCELIQKHEGLTVDPSVFHLQHNSTNINVNFFARASLTFNFNRWRAGLNASFNNYYYSLGNIKMSSAYGSLTAYLGYCFGRKKVYRYNGAKRQDYIAAALTKKQIEEMKDTLPAGNLDLGPTYRPTMGKTPKYHTDNYDIGIHGCDLVKGPEGYYGWFEIEDGYVTPGQDTDGRLQRGKRLPLSKDGRFICQAGHSSNFRAGNWWKSQLKIDQIPNYWYPEMLHYALRGNLVLYLRGRIFGTKRPVRVVINDFCINHGKETQDFSQVGIKSFHSLSTFSIEGNVTINDRNCRIYIEQKRRGKQTDLYVSRIYDSNANWMGLIDGSRTIGSLSLPGTHDSGTSMIAATGALFRSSHTQNFSVPAQTLDGIRAFDIRLKKDLHYGHTLVCRDRFDSTMVAWDRFLTEHPTEVLVAMIGSDEGGKWGDELTANFSALVEKYRHRLVEDFTPTTPLDSVRGKILVIRRQEGCPFGKLLKFTDNATFTYDCFHVEDVYKQPKTWKKIKIVEQHIREAYENEDPHLWYITFNSIAWSPRRHNPYSYAWGGKAKNIRKPMNKSLREFIELKDYNNFGIVYLDFYNDHGDNPQIVETIIRSNFNREGE